MPILSGRDAACLAVSTFGSDWRCRQLAGMATVFDSPGIREADIRDLDEDIRPYVSAPAPLEDWAVVRLDRWSLAATQSPLYPEDRFQCKLIRQVLATLPDGAEFRVEISEPKRWFWWTRNYRTLTASAELNSE